MMLAKGSGNGRETLLIGLSAENVERLAKNQPILKKLDEVGFPGLSLVILFGETEDDIREDLNIISRGQLQ